MTDTNLEPLYVDAKAEERWRKIAAILWPAVQQEEFAEYLGAGTLFAPFLTLEEARAVQKPGQAIIIAGYATIGPANGA